jgi:hypothetical protein
VLNCGDPAFPLTLLDDSLDFDRFYKIGYYFGLRFHDNFPALREAVGASAEEGPKGKL